MRASRLEARLTDACDQYRHLVLQHLAAKTLVETFFHLIGSPEPEDDDDEPFLNPLFLWDLAVENVVSVLLPTIDEDLRKGELLVAALEEEMERHERALTMRRNKASRRLPN